MSTSTDRMSGPAAVSDLLLERFALGELPADRLASVQALVDADPRLQARLRDLQNDSRATLLQHPPRRVAAEVRARAGVAAPRKRSPLVWAVPGLVVAAAALLAVQLGSPTTPDDLAKGDAGTVAVEHDPELRIFREDDGELTSGDAVAAGDVLGFRYDAAGYDFGALFSIDGAGVVTLHMPEAGDAAHRLEQGLVTLTMGYELDDAPDFERFFLVLSDHPFDLSAVLEAATELADDAPADGPLRVDTSLEVVDFVVDKDAP